MPPPCFLSPPLSGLQSTSREGFRTDVTPGKCTVFTRALQPFLEAIHFDECSRRPQAPGPSHELHATAEAEQKADVRAVGVVAGSRTSSHMRLSRFTILDGREAGAQVAKIERMSSFVQKTTWGKPGDRQVSW